MTVGDPLFDTPIRSTLLAMHTLRAQKRALRKAVTATLQQLSRQEIESQSKSVVDKVLALPQFRQCKSSSCYLSMPTGEVDTSSLVSEILRGDRHAGKTLFVPKIESKDGKMRFLKVYGLEDLNSFPSGVWGIKEPELHWRGTERQDVLDGDSPPLDVILLPAVAFDRSLSRLGHGKGYYDRFIATYVSDRRPRPLLVGLALREQVLEADKIPMGDHDWKMDLVITPDAVIKPSSIAA